MTALHPSPARCTTLAECRLGDWEDSRFVREWILREGIQRYQPLRLGKRGRNPFDETRFDYSRPIWEFERCLSPRLVDLGSHAVWKRIA